MHRVSEYPARRHGASKLPVTERNERRHGASEAFSQVSLQQFPASYGQTATAAGSVLLQVTSGSVILYTSTTDNRTNDSALFVVRPAG